MLPRPNRLPKTVFFTLFRKASREQNDDFQMRIYPNSLKVSRFAVQVSKKTAKHAVDRNRIKRLVRESISHLLPTIKPGFDCIMIAKTNFADQQESSIEKSVRNLLAERRLISNYPN